MVEVSIPTSSPPRQSLQLLTRRSMKAPDQRPTNQSGPQNAPTKPETNLGLGHARLILQRHQPMVEVLPSLRFRALIPGTPCWHMQTAICAFGQPAAVRLLLDFAEVSVRLLCEGHVGSCKFVIRSKTLRRSRSQDGCLASKETKIPMPCLARARAREARREPGWKPQQRPGRSPSRFQPTRRAQSAHKH